MCNYIAILNAVKESLQHYCETSYFWSGKYQMLILNKSKNLFDYYIQSIPIQNRQHLYCISPFPNCMPKLVG